MTSNKPIIEALSQEDIFNQLVKETPLEPDQFVVKLPSKGIGYKSIKNGTVTLRAMTFDDEKFIAKSTGAGEETVDLLINRCCDRINTEELYSFDKVFLMLKIREISYGAKYTTIVMCNSCKGENNVTINLDKINVTEVPEDFSPEFDIELPTTKWIVKLKLPTSNLIKYLNNVETLDENLWRFVKSITLKGNVLTDYGLISKALERINLIEKKLIIKALNPEFGVQTKIKFICSHCDKSELKELPISSDFFTVN